MVEIKQETGSVVGRIVEFTGMPAIAALKILQSVRGDELQFVNAVVEQGLISDANAYRSYAEVMGLEFESPDLVDLDASVLQIAPVEAMRRYRAVPLRWDRGALVVAMANPLDLMALDGLQETLGSPVLPVLTTPRFLGDALRHREQVEQGVEGLLAKFELRAVDESALANPQKLREIAGEGAIVQLVDFIVDQAMRRRASDIHIEQGRECLRVRYRIDGNMETVHRLPKTLHSAVITRLKILASLDIAERRRPQDGRFRRDASADRAIELRVSTLPSMHGEKVVLRILDKGRVSLDLAAQGFTPSLAKALLGAAEAPNGMVLVTGPTGSGKTTTLYGVLSVLNTEDRNVVTVEDPVEYEMPGITQVQVDAKAERTFSSVLRSILRQDPDVIMVGEIRDHETAELAVHAALTGHLVLSTLHTNSAVGTATRLIDIGVERYLLGPTLRAIVGQRLVRRLCECAQPCAPPVDLLRSVGRAAAPGKGFRRPVGCRSCRDAGFTGRVPIHEVLTWTPELCGLLTRGADEQALGEAARAAGFATMVDDGVLKASDGVTTVEEVLAAARM